MGCISGEDIGRVLKRLIKEKNMSQGDVSRATNIKRSYISHIFCGNIKNPRLDTFNKLADSLGMSVTELIDKIENGNKKRGKIK